MIILQTDIIQNGIKKIFATLPFEEELKDSFLNKRKEEWRKYGWTESNENLMRMTNGNDSLEFSIWPVVTIDKLITRWKDYNA